MSDANGPKLLFRESPYRKTFSAAVIAAEDGAVQLDQTLFFPSGGGQPADQGTLQAQGSSWTVADVRKGPDGAGVWHVLEGEAPPPGPGTVVDGEIDWTRRQAHMRMHTALHLLCAAVTGDVTGGQIGAAQSRLDFNIPGDAVDREAISARINAWIEADLPVEERWITDSELAEKPELVRTLSVQPPSGQGWVRLIAIGPTDQPIDLQPCGGTHVASTGEIGPLSVTGIKNKGRQNRRITIALAE